MKMVRGLVAFGMVAAMASGSGQMMGSGQQAGSSQSHVPTPGLRDDPAAASRNSDAEEKQRVLRNDERQRRLVADTEKLLALATQLHEDVGKTDKNVLSMDVVRRAQEIEKLARDVKDRMKG